MQQSILPVAEINIDKVTYADVRNNLSGKGKNIPVAYSVAGSGVRLVVQTPKMHAPFGLDRFETDDGGGTKYSLTVSYKGRDTNPKMQAFYDLMSAIDERNVTEACKNQALWWPGNAPKGRDIVEDRYTRIVTRPKDAKYDSNTRFKIPFRNERFETMVFDDSCPPQQVEADYLAPMTQVICLIELGPLWIADKKFGQTVKLIQCKAYKARSIQSYAITDDGDGGNMDTSDVERNDYEPMQ